MKGKKETGLFFMLVVSDIWTFLDDGTPTPATAVAATDKEPGYDEDYGQHNENVDQTTGGDGIDADEAENPVSGVMRV